MAKQGMKRPEPNGNESNKKNHDASSVPVIQGKAKSGKEKAKPVKKK